MLERLSDAQPGPACLRLAGHVLSVEPDVAAGDAHPPGYQAEQRALAGTVRPDERMPGARRHREVDAVHGVQCAEGTAYVHTAQYVGHDARPAFAGRRSPATPRGSAYTTVMKTRPSTSGP